MIYFRRIVLVFLILIAVTGAYFLGTAHGWAWGMDSLRLEVEGNLAHRVEAMSRLRTGDVAGCIDLTEGSIDQAILTLPQEGPFTELPVATQRALMYARTYRSAFPSDQQAVNQALHSIPPLPADHPFCSDALRKVAGITPSNADDAKPLAMALDSMPAMEPGPANEHEALLEQFTQDSKELADILRAVVDEQSAEAAVEAIDGYDRRVRGFKSEIEKRLKTPQPADTTKRLRGTLVTVDGHRLTIRPGLGPTSQPRGDAASPVSLSLDEHVEVSLDGIPAKVADLLPGMIVEYLPVPGRGERPSSVMLSATSPSIDGTVLKIDGDVIVLHVTSGGDQGKDIRIVTNKDTRINFVGIGRDVAPRTAEVSELTTGTRLKVIPATFTAKVIYARPNAKQPTSQPADNSAAVP